MATTSSSTISPHHFTPIEEGNEEEEFPQGGKVGSSEYTHNHPTPPSSGDNNKNRMSSKKRQDHKSHYEVSCNKCRPSSNREKIISVVPLENGSSSSSSAHQQHRLSIASPNALFKSIISTLRKSPRLPDDAVSIPRSEDHWRLLVSELSTKLVQATRKRDDALLESSKLKFSMAELEKKLNKLEIYCHTLKSGLDVCNNKNLAGAGAGNAGDRERVITHFLELVSEARSTVRILGRALSGQLRQMGGKVYERISLLLEPYDIKLSSRSHRGLLLYLEALLNRALYEDFESGGFQKSGPSPILNPIDRCEANLAMFSRLRGLTWEEVLSKGTRHFSEDFSRFCDRKMSEVVTMLGWNRAWPEPLLQAFFGASKAVWLVHLLANSVHPGLPVFRVDQGVGFDPVYMEDMGGGGDSKARSKLVPGLVRIMVTPGFYVYDNVVKCKVLCRYYNNNNGGVHDFYDKGCTPSPSPS